MNDWRKRLGMQPDENLYIGLVDCMIAGPRGARRLGKLFPPDLPEIFMLAHAAGAQ